VRLSLINKRKKSLLIEIKSRPGLLTGAAHTWTWSGEGRRFTDDNPLVLTNRKAPSGSSRCCAASRRSSSSWIPKPSDFSLARTAPENLHTGTRPYLDPFLSHQRCIAGCPGARWTCDPRARPAGQARGRCLGADGALQPR
jgi:hypothetical protein